MAAGEEYRKRMDAYKLEGRESVVMKRLRDMNSYLTKRESWYKKGLDFVEKRQIIVREALEVVYALCLLLLLLPNPDF